VSGKIAVAGGCSAWRPAHNVIAAASVGTNLLLGMQTIDHVAIAMAIADAHVVP
jgi:3-deoxy-D-manno-octulosonic-acid transferase